MISSNSCRRFRASQVALSCTKISDHAHQLFWSIGSPVPCINSLSLWFLSSLPHDVNDKPEHCSFIQRLFYHRCIFQNRFPVVPLSISMAMQTLESFRGLRQPRSHHPLFAIWWPTLFLSFFRGYRGGGCLPRGTVPSPNIAQCRVPTQAARGAAYNQDRNTSASTNIATRIHWPTLSFFLRAKPTPCG